VTIEDDIGFSGVCPHRVYFFVARQARAEREAHHQPEQRPRDPQGAASYVQSFLPNRSRNPTRPYWQALAGDPELARRYDLVARSLQRRLRSTRHSANRRCQRCLCGPLRLRTPTSPIHTIFWFQLSQCHRGALSRALNTNWEDWSAPA